jgi:hypothetical protein
MAHCSKCAIVSLINNVTFIIFPHLKCGKQNELDKFQGDKTMFKVNEANCDRIARVVLGIVLLYLGLGGVVAGGLGMVLDIFGAIFLLTGLVGFCPLYTLFKFSTKK